MDVVKAESMEQIHNFTGNGFFLGKDGIYCRKTTQIWEGCYPYNAGKVIPGDYIEIQPFVSYLLPIIPTIYFKQILSFFQWSYSQFKGEAGIYLYYNFKKKQYFLKPPKQEVSAGLVIGGREPSKEKDSQIVGYFHSHHIMDSSPSSTDYKDYSTINLLQGIVGKIFDPVPSVYLAMWLNNTEFKFRPSELIAMNIEPAFPENWKGYVSIIKPKTIGSNSLKNVKDNRIAGLQQFQEQYPIVEDYRHYTLPFNDDSDDENGPF